MMRTVLLLAVAIFIVQESFSQVNIQAYGSLIRNLNPNNKTNTSGGGIRFEFAKKESVLSKYIGISYDLPMYAIERIEAQAYDSWTTPSSQTVTARYSRPMLRLELGGRLYLKGEGSNFKGFNWYLYGGAEVICIQNKPTYSYYDQDKYTLGYTKSSDVNEDGSSKFGLHPFLAIGTGVEKSLGTGNIFLQGGIAFPVTNVGGDVSSGLEDFTPIPLYMNLGYKISLSRNK